MGIRYYAYAFDSDNTNAALKHPHHFVSADPLADALGLPHGFTAGTTNFEQGPPTEEMLYLDKLWPAFQDMTGPAWPDDQARPSYRMFEGRVTMLEDYSWRPWVRAIPPEEVPLIAEDLGTVSEADFIQYYLTSRANYHDRDAGEAAGVVHFLGRAQRFLDGLVESGRGFTYTIG